MSIFLLLFSQIENLIKIPSQEIQWITLIRKINNNGIYFYTIRRLKKIHTHQPRERFRV